MKKPKTLAEIALNIDPAEADRHKQVERLILREARTLSEERGGSFCYKRYAAELLPIEEVLALIVCTVSGGIISVAAEDDLLKRARLAAELSDDVMQMFGGISIPAEQAHKTGEERKAGGKKARKTYSENKKVEWLRVQDAAEEVREDFPQHARNKSFIARETKRRLGLKYKIGTIARRVR